MKLNKLILLKDKIKKIYFIETRLNKLILMRDRFEGKKYFIRMKLKKKNKYITIIKMDIFL